MDAGAISGPMASCRDCTPSQGATGGPGRAATLPGMNLKQALPLGVGFIAGIAFIVACPAPLQLSPSTSNAEPESWEPATADARQPSGCLQWEVITFAFPRWGGEGAKAPSGWEPFAAVESGVVARHCTVLEPGA